MRRLILAALLLLCLVFPTDAQERTITSATCIAGNSTGCVEFTVNGAGTMGVQISGSFTATLQFEQSINLADWVSWSVLPYNSATAVTQTTVPGVWTGTVAGMNKVRVRASDYTDGTASVYAVSAQAKAGGTRGVAPPVGTVIIDSVDDPAGHEANTQPLSWTFTNAASTLLVCGMSASQVGPDLAPIFTSMTVDGQDLTEWATYVAGSPILTGDANRLSYFYKLNPPVGDVNIQAFFEFNGDPDQANHNVMGGCIGFTGNDPTIPLGPAVKTTNSTTASDTGTTITIPSTTRGNIVLAMMNTGSGGIAVTGPSAARWLLNNSTHTGGDNGALASRTSGGGSESISFTFNADIWMAMAVEVFAEGTAHGH